jgi:hypothetical protein
MRLTHSARFAALLAPLLLTHPLAAQVPGGLRTTPRAQAPGNGTTVIIWPRHIQTLQARLDSFAVALPSEERALWNAVLVRAASAPTPAAGEVRVAPVLEIGPGGGCEVGPGGGCEGSPGMTGTANRVAIIVQGGRTAGASGIVVQGGRTATPSEGIVVQGGRTATPTEGIVVQGGRTSGGAAPATTPVGGRPGAQGAEVRRPNEAVAIDSKLQPVPWLASESLGRRLAELSLRLSAEERGTLNWLLTRASASDIALPPGPCNPERGCHAPGDSLSSGAQKLDLMWRPMLTAALGIEPRGRRDQRWVLRF